MNENPRALERAEGRRTELRTRIQKLTGEQRKLLSQIIAEKAEIENRAAMPESMVPQERKRLIAYVVSNQDASNNEIDSESIKRDLRSILPEHMIPESINIVGEFARLPNGKIDLSILPEPNVRQESSCEFVGPRNETEQTLTDIWSNLLQVEPLGVHDNFFEFGGDSILSIQMVSRVREAGLAIEPRQLADFPTIAGLASVLTQRSETAVGAITKSTGTMGLTPIQHWFFSRNLSTPNHWNQWRLLDIQQDVGLDSIREAVGVCVDHHDGLRATFDGSGGAFKQTVSEISMAIDDYFEVVEVSASELNGQSIVETAIRCHKSLDVGKGPLIRFVYFKANATTDNHAGKPMLFMAAHHLVVDNISWSILIDDLNRACLQLSQGQPIKLPTRTSSIATWTQQLKKYACEQDRRASIQFWKQLCDHSIGTVPVDIKTEGTIDEASARQVVVMLDEQTTLDLQSNAHETYGTQTQDLLLSAMALTLAQWTASERVRFDIEGHGRELISDKIDLARTVGWFTSYFPVAFSVSSNQTDDMGGFIKSTKETIRSLPSHGLDFGVSRYLSDDKSEIYTLQQFQPNDVLFNFAGSSSLNAQRGSLLANSPLAETLGLDRIARDSGNERSHSIEVNAAIVRGRLVATWIYSELLHHQSTIEKWANEYLASLARLIKHGKNSEGKEFTPSDFPESGLNQDELDAFLDGLG